MFFGSKNIMEQTPRNQNCVENLCDFHVKKNLIKDNTLYKVIN